MCDGNEAASSIAYRATELAIIYPITPSSPMAENYETWSDAGKPNVFGHVPEVAAMQSEAGAIGAVHGALQAGSLVTTFTASQGLLLMIPNMYKIAGELHPFVMHVSARTIAKHALSIFGDHSDVMACRQTGFAMLCSNSVQEAHDFALVAHAATLDSRVPFIHFFDGFRTSHEVNMIDAIPDDAIRAMLDDGKIGEFRARALRPEAPAIRGTAQNPDVFFQASEAANPFYGDVGKIVSAKFAELEKLTGRRYAALEYAGAEDAERVIVCMGSGCETIETSIDKMNREGARVGLVKVRLYRPFPAAEFADILPGSVKKISVLDRTKEAGSIGEPLYLDVVAALEEAGRAGLFINGGRYGLSSKEFTPSMVKAVFDELDKPEPKREFTVGINDDVTRLSLDCRDDFALDDSNMSQALFYGLGSDGTVGANKNSIKIITGEGGLCGQAYFEYDSKKSGGNTISHLRFSSEAIRAPYLVSNADFVAVHHFPLFYTLDMLKNAKPGATLLINSPYKKEALWDALPLEVQEAITGKKLAVFAINANAVARDSGMGRRINTIMQTAFFHLAGVIPSDKAIASIKKAIEKTYSKKGPEIVAMNFKAVDSAIANIYRVEVPARPSANARPRPAVVSSDATEIVKRLEAKIIALEGNSLPVSAFDPDGTFPSATSRYEKRSIAESVPVWSPEDCIQCGKCALACPHAAIRTKAAASADLAEAPAGFKHAPYKTKELGEGLEYIVQCSPKDCTGCGLCVAGCPVKKENGGHAINMKPLLEVVDGEDRNFAFFETIPYIDRAKLNPSLPKHTQLMRPLFEFSGACAGCGEAGYIRLVTQLYGERMVVANATGCSSIYGGNLPTTPYCKNDAGFGPAWSNSLFEDNAEYGYGQAVAMEKQRSMAASLLRELAPSLGDSLVGALIDSPQKAEADIAAQRDRIAALKEKLAGAKDGKSRMLLALADSLLKKSVWIFGGDGWAYDIGYGGLDHVLNMDLDVNILVLDTEVYSNTGGQQSKSTPKGASAKFATGGRALSKKDLGLIAMANSNAYVAKIAMGANDAQAIKAIREAESFDGPSLIIAYSPCIAHGFDLVNGPVQARAAVETGHWELYRFDPRRIREGQPPLQLDSAPATRDIREYLLKETRYKAIAAANPVRFEEIIKEREFENRYKRAFFDYLGKFKLEE